MGETKGKIRNGEGEEGKREGGKEGNGMER